MIHQPSPPTAAIRADGPDQRWRAAGICLALAAITFAVFGQTAGFGFINFDDSAYVYYNPQVAGGLSWKGLAWVFTHLDCHLYHPLTMLSLMADYQLHGLHAGGYHFTNVVLHTASVILLFLVLRQMTGALWRSAFVAAVFAIHPLRVESVAWVAERKDVLGTFFFMLTLGAYVRYVRQPNSVGRYLTVAGAFVLALLSKPTVVTLPFLLLVLDYWPLNRFEQPRNLARLILEKIPLLALAIMAGLITVRAAGTEAIAPLSDLPMSARIGNALVSYVLYLRQMIWPAGLAVFYPRPEGGHPFWVAALSALVLLLITAGVLASGRRRPWMLVGWLWYLGMLLPMSGLVPVGQFARADRMTYLPQIGICLAATWLAAEWAAKWPEARVFYRGLMAGVVAALMVCAWIQTGYWKDSETLWAHTLACTTDNYVAQNNLGNELLQKGKVDEAIAHFQKMVEIKPNDAGAPYNLAIALDKNGRLDEAIAQYQKALQINPNYADAHYNLAVALDKKGRVDEAIAQYQKALQISPNDAKVRVNLGNALLQKGRVDEAIAQYQQALQINPDYAKAHYNLGIALEQKGSAAEAIAQYQQALQIAPADPEIQNNLAWLLATCAEASLRNGNQAVALARQASTETGGANPLFLDTLAAACAEAGRFSEAVETAQRALRLAEAQTNSELAGALQSELKLYQAGRPFHSPEQTR